MPLQFLAAAIQRGLQRSTERLADGRWSQCENGYAWLANQSQQDAFLLGSARAKKVSGVYGVRRHVEWRKRLFPRVSF